MKEISALIKGLPRGPSLHLLWEDLVRKRAWQRPHRNPPGGHPAWTSSLQSVRSERHPAWTCSLQSVRSERHPAWTSSLQAVRSEQHLAWNPACSR